MPACLVLMPSERELDVHFSLLKNLGERLGFTVSRIDGDQFSGNLLEPMAKAFSPAELIIADLTGNDPRVMYQLAVAQSMGKRVLIVTGDRDTMPFDISAYRSELIDPSSPELVEELFEAMKDLASSTLVTGPLGGQTILGQNLFVERSKAFAIDAAPFALIYGLLYYFFGLEEWEFYETIYGLPAFLAVFYKTITTWSWGSTFGQQLVGLQVMMVDGDPPSFAVSAGRSVAAVVGFGGFIFCRKGLSYRALHDTLTRTMVVRRGSTVA
jgi:uncharacterized RDD family membrane protein YckC